MSLQQASSFSMIINQMGCSISRTNSQTFYLETYEESMHRESVAGLFDNELFQMPTVVSSHSSSGCNPLQDFMVCGTGRSRVIQLVQAPGIQRSAELNPEQLAQNAIYGLGPNADAFVKRSSDSDEDKPVVTNEASLDSVESRVEDAPNIEHVVSGAGDLNSEPMAFLQGLNSGNLMQFSQQSVLREMMLQDLKDVGNTLPKLENHNLGGYNFSMVLDEPPKSHWMFSVALNKLYIRMDKMFNVDVQFKAKMPIQPLNLRVFLCFVKDVSGPVLRCQNHLSVESKTIQNIKVRESLLRCENPNTVYCGTAEGKGISERYSVLVPLNMCRSGNRSGGYIRQTLAFKFVCQNSCFGRKETCLVFCLENACGDIVGQQVLNVKICTCPKRDRNQDERVMGKKRKSEVVCSDDDYEPDVKPPKSRRRTTSYRRSVKEETESNDSPDEEMPASDWKVSRTADGEYQLSITCPKKEWLLQSIDGMIKEAAAGVLQSPNQANLRRHAHKLVGLKKRACDLP